MPYGKDRTGNSRHCKIRERRTRKACGKPGVLHTYFDGQRLCLCRRQSEELAQSEAAGVAEQVMKNDNGKYQSAACVYFLGVMRYNSGDDHTNRDG